MTNLTNPTDNKSNTAPTYLDFPTKIVTVTNHFKAYTAESKGLADIELMVANGIIIDQEKELTIGENDKKEQTVKRNSVSFAVPVVDMSVVLTGQNFSLNQIDHVQELVNGAMKKVVQKLVSDTERKAPLTVEDLPTWEAVLETAFLKRATAVKVTMDMVNTATKLLVEFLTVAGVKQGGIDLAEALCHKKFSLTALNTIKVPVIEKVQGLINGWFESMKESEQLAQLDVMDLWSKNIDAKLNPTQDDKLIEDIF